MNTGVGSGISSLSLLLFLFFLPGKLEASQFSQTPLETTNYELTRILIPFESYVIDRGDLPPAYPKPPYGLQALTTPIHYGYLPRGDRFRTIHSYPQPLEVLVSKMVSQYRTTQRIEILRRVLWLLLAFFCLFLTLGLVVAAHKRYKKRPQELASDAYLFILWLVCLFLLVCLYPNLPFTWQEIRERYFSGNLAVKMTFGGPMPPDDYSASYVYARSVDGDAFVYSRGPDLSVGEAFNGIAEKSTDDILETVVTYAPTNGLLSSGDIWTMIVKPGNKRKPLEGIWRHKPTGTGEFTSPR